MRFGREKGAYGTHARAKYYVMTEEDENSKEEKVTLFTVLDYGIVTFAGPTLNKQDDVDESPLRLPAPGRLFSESSEF
jgi:hypothetical protein